MIVVVKYIISFNPRTYIRYDRPTESFNVTVLGFNPRTYIRYDIQKAWSYFQVDVSIHVPI